eukprot:scaffold70238_cov31-Cyclotella_meneghiniana.AAC.2
MPRLIEESKREGWASSSFFVDGTYGRCKGGNASNERPNNCGLYIDSRSGVDSPRLNLGLFIMRNKHHDGVEHPGKILGFGGDSIRDFQDFTYNIHRDGIEHSGAFIGCLVPYLLQSLTASSTISSTIHNMIEYDTKRTFAILTNITRTR